MKRRNYVQSTIKITVYFLFIMIAGAFSAQAAKLTLAWDRPAGNVTGYRVYYGQEGSDYKTKTGKTIKSADQTTCEIAGLKEGERYNFIMKSFNDQGIESVFSEEISYTVPVSASDAGDSDFGGTDGGVPAEGGGTGDDGGSNTGGSGGWFNEKFFVTQVFDDGNFGTALLSAAFDSAGSLTYNELFRSSGEAQTNLKKSYTFTDEGLLFIDGEYKGVVSPQHKYYVTGNMAKDQYPCTRLGIRQSAGLTAADLRGEYRIFTYYRIPGTDGGQPVIASEAGMVSADGAGNISFQQGAGFAGTCEVNAQTGQLKITPTGTFSVMHGALSENGNIFTAVDADDSDNTLMYVIGVKASPTSISELAASYYMNEFTHDAQLATKGYLLDMFVEQDGSYSVVEIDNTCECPPESRSGIMSVDGSGQVQSIDNVSKTNMTGALSPDGELFTVVGQRSLGVGLQQEAAGQPSTGGETPTPDSGGGGGGGGGGCFIGTLAD